MGRNAESDEMMGQKERSTESGGVVQELHCSSCSLAPAELLFESGLLLVMTHVRWSLSQSGHECTDFTRCCEVPCLGEWAAWLIDTCSNKDGQ